MQWTALCAQVDCLQESQRQFIKIDMSQVTGKLGGIWDVFSGKAQPGSSMVACFLLPKFRT